MEPLHSALAVSVADEDAQENWDVQAEDQEKEETDEQRVGLHSHGQRNKAAVWLDIRVSVCIAHQVKHDHGPQSVLNLAN